MLCPGKNTGGAMPARTTFGTKQAFNRPAPEIAKPRAGAHAATPAEPAKDVARATWPVLTIGLGVVLVAIFLFELNCRVDPLPGASIGLRDDVALGGVGRYFVFHEHEWWRIFTAPFLHANTLHLLGNMMSLALSGWALERIVGRAWFAALFIVGGVAGSCVSLAYGSAVVSVGASGALVCFVTVLFALSFHYKAGRMANWMRIRGVLGIVSAFFPAAAHGAVQIDYGAHLGGFAAGIFLSFILLIFWSDEESPTPPLPAFAAGLAALGIAVTLYAGALVAKTFPFYAARSALLVPTEQLNDPEIAKESADLVARYPHDPYARFLRSADLFSRHDFGDAEDEARAGLSEHEILATECPPGVVQRLNTALALSLWGEGRKDEAKQVAAPLCALDSSDQFLTKSREILQRVGICGAAEPQ